VVRAGSHGDPNAELASSLTDKVRHHPVHADGSEYERHAGEGSEEMKA